MSAILSFANSSGGPDPPLDPHMDVVHRPLVSFSKIMDPRGGVMKFTIFCLL